MGKKAQAAMEFLMTYGWAIIVVLAAIGALAYFGVLDVKNLLPERTIFPAPIQHVDNALIKASDNTVEIAFQNTKGVSIRIPLVSTVTPSSSTSCANATMNGTYLGTAIPNSTTIPNGANFLLKWYCGGTGTVGERFKATISFDYVNVDTTQTMREVGSVEGKYS